MFCYYCLVADKRDLKTCKDETFSKIGFCNWKKTLSKFDKHEQTMSHREAIDVVVTIPSITNNVGEMLSSSLANQRSRNKKILLVILSNIKFFARQGLALRGQYVSGDDSTKGGENDSNFIQLLRGKDDPSILKWMEKVQDKFTSHEIQNEILSIMALYILREIATSISGKKYTIMVDETIDISNTEQLVVCLRYVDDNLEVLEGIVGYYSMESTTSTVIVTTITDVLLRMNLSISNCRGQCYDGASSISRSSVAIQLSEPEPKALYTHYYGHSLNLAI